MRYNHNQTFVVGAYILWLTPRDKLSTGLARKMCTSYFHKLLYLTEEENNLLFPKLLHRRSIGTSLLTPQLCYLGLAEKVEKTLRRIEWVIR
jgi:hypothetical protein